MTTVLNGKLLFEKVRSMLDSLVFADFGLTKITQFVLDRLTYN